MTAMTIVSNYAKKTAKPVGVVAAGEVVHVTISDVAADATDWAASTLRLRVMSCAGTLAMYPQPTASGTIPAAQWDVDGDTIACDLNLNSVQMVAALRHLALRELYLVLDDTAAHVKYFSAPVKIEGWRQEVAGDPYDLSAVQTQIAAWEAQLDNMSVSAERFTDPATGKSGVEITAWDGKGEEPAPVRVFDAELDRTAVEAERDRAVAAEQNLADAIDEKVDKHDGKVYGSLTIGPRNSTTDSTVVFAGETVGITTPDPVTQTFSHRTLTWPAADGTLTTEERVAAIVNALKNGAFRIVATLPATGEAMVIYLVAKEDSETGDVYDEYIWVDGAWEHIGSTQIDLEGYVRSVNSQDPDLNGNVALSAFDIPLGPSNVADVIDNKVDRDTSASEGNIPVFDSNGNIEDSGKKPTDFAPATNIPKTALASAVQASLDKADNAATKADATLTENEYTAWAIVNTPLTTAQKEAFYAESASAAENDYAVTIQNSTLYVGGYAAASLTLSADSLTAFYDAGSSTASSVWGVRGDVVATRKAQLNYTLGSQTDKPLQPAGDYAAATKTVTVTATETMLPPDCFPIRYADGGTTVELSADEVEFTSQFVLRVKDASPVIALASFARPNSGQTIADYSQHPDITFGGRAPTTGVWPAYLREGETYSVTYPVVYRNDIAPLAPLASPAFTGAPTAPTPTAGDNTTKVATTAFVQAVVPYTIGDNIVIGSNSVRTDTTDPSNPITYAEAALTDRTANVVTVEAAIDELRVTFPAFGEGKVRDFGLTIAVGDGTAALAAPALAIFGAGGEPITLVNPDGAMPELADGTATAEGITALYFSELELSAFLVKGEQVQEITQ